MNDPFAEIIDDIQHNGLRWVTVIAIIGLIRKERRNHLLNKRDEALFLNQKVIMEALGVGGQWKDSPRLGFRSTDLPSFNQWLRIYWMAIFQRKSNYPRRKRKMNQNTNFATLLPGLAGVIKLILQSFGLEVPDQHINDILNGVAALAAVIAVFMSHRKAKTATTTETKSTTTETTTVQPVQSIENGGNQIVDTKFTVDTGANK